MLTRVAVFLALTGAVLAQGPSPGGRRLALVISNSDYKNLSGLQSPTKDAQLMAETLKTAGFRVERTENMRFPEFLTSVEKPFLASVRPGDTVVFYYSGYAVQGDDDNYLIPVDFQPKSALDLQDRSYHLSRMQQGLDDAGAALKIFILETARTIGTSVTGVPAPGLMLQPDIPRNALFAFASAPGQTVPDSGSELSMFTQTLARSMAIPGRRVLDIFGEAKREVSRKNPNQSPYVQENILEPDFFFIYPALSVGPSALAFDSPTGVSPPPQSFSVFAENYSGRFSVSGTGVKWLTISAESPKTPASPTPVPNVRVAVNPAGLEPGRYEGKITIAAPDSDMTSSPQIVTVTYTVTPERKQSNSPLSNKIDREEYLFIPSGQFKMGCVPGDKLCAPDEKQQHSVTLTKSFWMGRNEVQVDSYRRFSKKMPTGPLWDSHWRTGDLPVVNVTWENARDYCRWAGGRLPTEAEWEYAERAGATDEIYPLNDENSRDKANFYGKKGNDIYEQPAPVRKFDPNPFGLYDLAGNVWEWVNDFYSPDYSESRGVDPAGAADGKQHVIRGGSYDSDAKEHLRISIRRKSGKAEMGIGFRCVLEDTDQTRNNLTIQ
jgi:formylglycine-generating enzyme required for sulfatase activity